MIGTMMKWKHRSEKEPDDVRSSLAMLDGVLSQFDSDDGEGPGPSRSGSWESTRADSGYGEDPVVRRGSRIHQPRARSLESIPIYPPFSKVKKNKKGKKKRLVLHYDMDGNVILPVIQPLPQLLQLPAHQNNKYFDYWGLRSRSKSVSDLTDVVPYCTQPLWSSPLRSRTTTGEGEAGSDPLRHVHINRKLKPRRKSRTTSRSVRKTTSSTGTQTTEKSGESEIPPPLPPRNPPSDESTWDRTAPDSNRQSMFLRSFQPIHKFRGESENQVTDGSMTPVAIKNQLDTKPNIYLPTPPIPIPDYSDSDNETMPSDISEHQNTELNNVVTRNMAKRRRALQKTIPPPSLFSDSDSMYSDDSLENHTIKQSETEESVFSAASFHFIPNEKVPENATLERSCLHEEVEVLSCTLPIKKKQESSRKSEEVTLDSTLEKFDAIKKMLEEGLIEGLEESPPSFIPPPPPPMRSRKPNPPHNPPVLQPKSSNPSVLQHKSNNPPVLQPKSNNPPVLQSKSSSPPVLQPKSNSPPVLQPKPSNNSLSVQAKSSSEPSINNNPESKSKPKLLPKPNLPETKPIVRPNKLPAPEPKPVRRPPPVPTKTKSDHNSETIRHNVDDIYLTMNGKIDEELGPARRRAQSASTSYKTTSSYDKNDYSSETTTLPAKWNYNEKPPRRDLKRSASFLLRMKITKTADGARSMLRGLWRRKQYSLNK